MFRRGALPGYRGRPRARLKRQIGDVLTAHRAPRGTFSGDVLTAHRTPRGTFPEDVLTAHSAPRGTFSAVTWFPGGCFHRAELPPGYDSGWGTICDATPVWPSSKNAVCCAQPKLGLDIFASLNGPRCERRPVQRCEK